MFSVTELRNGAIFQENNQPFLVLKYEHQKVGRGNANIKIKARNLKTGAVLSKTFLSGRSIEEADVKRETARFLYRDNESIYFSKSDSKEKISLPLVDFQDNLNYLKKTQEIKIIFFEDEPISLELPPHVDLAVKETGPNYKGNTVTGSTKPATLETGLTIQVPMFVKEDDVVRVNTRTGQYVERVKR